MRACIRRVAALTCLVSAACSPTEGPSGVHVTIDLADGGWEGGEAFDHVTLTATGDSLHAVACFSPTIRGFLPAGRTPDGGDPCADTPLSWPLQGVPTATVWTQALPMSANFVSFPAGTQVSVTAEAHLGGGPALGAASGPATSAIGGSTLPLHLGKSSTPPVSCEVSYIEAVDGGPFLTACEGQVEPCCSIVDNPLCSGRSTPATSCLDGGVLVNPALIAPGCDEVVHTVIGIEYACASLALHGHFFRCAGGAVDAGDAGDAGCIPTADCDVPDGSALVLLHKKGSTAPTAVVPLACVPPFSFPVTLETSKPYPRPDEVVLVVPPSSSPRACLFAYDRTALVGTATSKCL